MKHSAVTLDDKYEADSDRFYLTGTQALVRLPILQRQRDRALGLNTAGYVSGYRGSPLGQIDIQMWQAKKQLTANHIVFQPGVNEELAATAIWGTQQVPLLAGARYDGVFAYWYGKGPGVDRAGDALQHANYAGTTPTGGVLAMAGDDHACKSSTVPHQSEPALIAAHIPVLVPADVRDLLELGLHGWAMSRWSGRWIGFKTVADVVDSSASVEFDLAAFQTVSPEGPHPNAGYRLPDPPLEQEARVFNVGIPAALAYARANQLDRITRDPPGARLGLITLGKSYHDTSQALADLGLAPDAPVRVLKIALAWPLDPDIIRRFANGLEEIVVVEEKAPILEQQVRDILYDAANRPAVYGKRAPEGLPFLKSNGEFSAAEIALALSPRIARIAPSDELHARTSRLRQHEEALARTEILATRRPYFCSGCPHNTSTKVIDGSRALAGIGCHTLALYMDRSTATFSQMGGEGAQWFGQAPFTEEKHVFANIGDGTYFHSGIMAIRAAVASRTNITYKLLFNDAVAMTGGQPVDGPLTVPQITRQVAAEGVVKIAIVTDEPEKYDDVSDLAPGVTVHHRRDMQSVEATLRDTEGCTVLVYDQTCASEKRRRRKRGTFPNPAKRAFINTAVCEGCGDCSTASNCLSVQPEETALGTKRRIDQSSCNKDFSCIEGFCPSFVTVHGAEPKKRSRSSASPDATLPEPTLPSLAEPWNILVTGIGGTGIVTIGALLGMAAHLDGLHVTVLDQMGMAQKGGSVTSHIRLSATQEGLHGLKVGEGDADLLLACDMVVAAGKDALATLRQGVTHAVLNTHEVPTGDFVMHADRLPGARLRRAIAASVDADKVSMLDATALATALMGDSIATNPFMLGFAWQKGFVPLSLDSLLRAIELNGTAVEANKTAFAWGRAAALDTARVAATAGIETAPAAPPTLEQIIETRATHLAAYQNRRYARRYRALVARVAAVEAPMFSGSTALTEAVARGYHKLLAYKDEYEVARLYASKEFRDSLAANFETPKRLEFHLAPPLLAKRDPRTGHLLKRSYGPWILTAMRLLAPFKRLRGTSLDPFGRTAERQAERALIAEYETTIDDILQHLSPETLATATALASLPERIKGFGHVKERAMREAGTERARLLDQLRNPVRRAA